MRALCDSIGRLLTKPACFPSYFDPEDGDRKWVTKINNQFQVKSLLASITVCHSRKCGCVIQALGLVEEAGGLPAADFTT